MGSLCGILGQNDKAAVGAMARAFETRGTPIHQASGTDFCVAASHPIDAHSPCIVDGETRDRAGHILSPDRVRTEFQSKQDGDVPGIFGAYAAAASIAGGVRWWLTRDRLGRRPLYYFRGKGFLLFASELKALLASGLVSKQLELLSVDRYLTLRCVPGPETMIHGIHHVPPGHVVEFSHGEVRILRLWGFDLEADRLPKDSAAARIRELLESAICRAPTRQLLWSAGIDCAAIAALTPEARPVHVNLEGTWQDEGRLARESARQMGQPLETIQARRLTEEGFQRAVNCLDEPIADASLFPLWMVAEAASEHGDQFLTGHGADELLGGYARYHFLEKAKGVHRFVPAGLVTDLIPSLPPNAFVRRAGQSLAFIRDTQESYLSLVSVFDRGERATLYTQAMRSALAELGEIAPPLRETFTQPDLTRNVLSLDLQVGLPNVLLAMCDRVAAAHGIVWHHPYLDDALVDFALRLSPEVKFGVRSKPLLRIAVKGHLPGAIRQRARRGFRIPQSGRVQRVIDRVAAEVITPERVDSSGLFRWQTVEGIVRGASHNVYRRRQFWALLMFFSWYRNVMEN